MSRNPMKDDMEEGQVMQLSLYDRAMIDFAQKILTSDLEVLRSFSKLMITLSTSLFPVYFAVLKFVNSTATKAPFLIVFSIVVSIFLLISLFFFALALFPSKGKFVPMDLTSIKEFRERTMREKLKYVIAGLITFSISLISMVIQFLVLIYFGL